MLNLLKWLTRIAGLCALVLGILFWRGMFTGALTTHMALGGIVALVLAILALLALSVRVRVPVAVLSLLWAAATLYVGIMQSWWPRDSYYSIIQIVHPLLGIGAIGLSEMLGGAISRQRTSLA
jgi:hypothetical protein